MISPMARLTEHWLETPSPGRVIKLECLEGQIHADGRKDRVSQDPSAIECHRGCDLWAIRNVATSLLDVDPDITAESLCDYPSGSRYSADLRPPSPEGDSQRSSASSSLDPKHIVRLR